MVGNVPDKMGTKMLKDAQVRIRNREASREKLREIIFRVVDASKRGRSTQPTRDEWALVVAKAELEGGMDFRFIDENLVTVSAKETKDASRPQYTR